MQDMNRDEGQRPVSISRSLVTVRGRAVEGDDPGIVETIEITDITPACSEELAITRYSYCGGCNRIIKDATQIAARCVGCGTVLCTACSTAKCANEYCQKIVCPSCREIWGGLVYCKQHARAEHLKRAAGFVVIVVVVGFAIFFLLRLIS